MPANLFFYRPKWRPRRQVVLVDMDGTLADSRHREHFVQGKRKNWKAFFNAMDADEPNAAIAERVLELADGHEIVIVTGRPEVYLQRSDKSKFKIRKSKFLLYSVPQCQRPNLTGTAPPR